MLLTFVLIIVGIYAIYGSVKKPSFFWNNRKAMRLRKLIGDTPTSIFYTVLGAILVIVGIFGMFNGGLV